MPQMIINYIHEISIHHILLKTKSLGPTLAKQAYADLVSKYSYKVVAKQLSKIINKTIKRFGPWCYDKSNRVDKLFNKYRNVKE